VDGPRLDCRCRRAPIRVGRVALHNLLLLLLLLLLILLLMLLALSGALLAILRGMGLRRLFMLLSMLLPMLLPMLLLLLLLLLLLRLGAAQKLLDLLGRWEFAWRLLNVNKGPRIANVAREPPALGRVAWERGEHGRRRICHLPELLLLLLLLLLPLRRTMSTRRGEKLRLVLFAPLARRRRGLLLLPLLLFRRPRLVPCSWLVLRVLVKLSLRLSIVRCRLLLGLVLALAALPTALAALWLERLPLPLLLLLLLLLWQCLTGRRSRLLNVPRGHNALEHLIGMPQHIERAVHLELVPVFFQPLKIAAGPRDRGLAPSLGFALAPHARLFLLL
jgi:hypothetical protein